MMSKAKDFNLRLSKARKPDPPQPPGRGVPDVAQINALISVCKANLVTQLTYLAFVMATLVGVSDIDFFIPGKPTQLPMIGATIPTTLFFAIAPVLVLVLYAHLHFYLVRLWDALARQDATVSDRISPWLVADFALSGREQRIREFPLQRLANGVVYQLIFLAAPIVLVAFWWRSMPKHDPWLTFLFCGLPLSLSFLVGVSSWKHLRSAMLRVKALRRFGRALLGWSAVSIAVLAIGWVRTMNTLVPYTELAALSGTSYFEREREEMLATAQQLGAQVLGDRFGPYADVDDLDYLVERGLYRRWWMRATIWPDLLAKAQLAEAVFVQTPADWLPRDEAEQAFRGVWCEKQGLPLLVCGPGPRAETEPPVFLNSQREQWCSNLFRPGDDRSTSDCAMHLADLDGPYEDDWWRAREDALALLPTFDFSGADLRGADLAGARLEGADLGEARLERANLREARLEKANLWSARLEGADLGGARLEGANLWRARLTGAGLVAARLEGANLMAARLEGANLWRARLTGAALGGARLEGADLGGARLEGADLGGARLEGVDLWGAGLEGTDFSAATLNGAALKMVDLTGSRGADADQLKSAFGDVSVILPEHLRPAPEHWPDWELDFDEFNEQYRLWRANPAAYTPPPKPTD